MCYSEMKHCQKKVAKVLWNASLTVHTQRLCTHCVHALLAICEHVRAIQMCKSEMIATAAMRVGSKLVRFRYIATGTSSVLFFFRM